MVEWRSRRWSWLLILASIIGALEVGAVAPGKSEERRSEEYSGGYAAYQARNYAEAMRLFRRCSEFGDQNCMYYIGKMYENGLGVNRDYQEAQSW